MIAPQDLTRIALQLGMGKVTQEQLAAFAREVLAEQAAEVERLKGALADSDRRAGSYEAEAHRFADDADRFRARLETAHQEARDNLDRAEMAEVKLKQAEASAAALASRAKHLADACNARLPAEAFTSIRLEWEQLVNLLAQDVPGAGLLVAYQKALVRARNEAREGVARALIAKRDETPRNKGTRRDGLELAATLARALKEGA